MKDIKIAKKFLLTFGVIMLILIVVAGYSLFAINGNKRDFQNFYSKTYQLTNKTYEMNTFLQAESKNVCNAILETSGGKAQEYIGKAQEYANRLSENSAYISKNAQSAEFKRLSSEVSSLLAKQEETQEKMFHLAENMQDEEAAALYFDAYEPALLQIQDKIAAMDQYAGEYAGAAFEENRKGLEQAFIILAVITIAALSFTVLIGIYLTKCLTRPVFELAYAAKVMAQGSMDAEITYAAQDELGELAECMRDLEDKVKVVIQDISHLLGEMASGNFQEESKAESSYIGEYREILSAMKNIGRRLSSTLSEINIASGQVSVGADQVSSAAQSLSRGTAEQASSVEQLSATIADIARNIKENADNAVQASTIAQNVGSDVVESNKYMQELMQAMNEITDTSNEINKIIKTIEDIAFQTNILALNAAVEAARAGSAGKGFAVVADEVRNLAGKSAEAAKNTTMLIENAISAIEKGQGIAVEAASSLEIVVQKAGSIIDKIQLIAKASERQADAAEQVTTGIEQISSVVQTNSATAQESAAASEELSSQAQMLKNLVGSFRLREGNP